MRTSPADVHLHGTEFSSEVVAGDGTLRKRRFAKDLFFVAPEADRIFFAFFTISNFSRSGR
jgi:hypothetical protein